MLLPVSNPVNLLAVDSFGITLGEYLKFTLLPSVVAITINIGLFMYIFRKDIAASFRDEQPEPPVKIDAFFRFVCVVLILTAIGYVLASVYGKPVSWPAMGGAVALLAGGFAFRRLKVRGVASGISWSIFIFIFGLALLVRGLENKEVTQAIGEAVAHVSSAGTLWAVWLSPSGTAIGANLVNNWSMMMISVSSLASVGRIVRPQPHLRQRSGGGPGAQHHHPGIAVVDAVAGLVETEGAGHPTGSICEAGADRHAADADHQRPVHLCLRPAVRIG